MSSQPSNRAEQMGIAPIGRLLFSLGLPGIISMLIMTLYNITDTFWVAKLGPGAIAALTITFPYQLLLVAIGVGSGAGFSSLISRRFGAGRSQETNHIAGQLFPLTIGYGLVFTFFTTFMTRPVLQLFGVTPDIYAPAATYLFYVGLGASFTFFSMMSNNVLRGSGNTFAPMIFMGIAAITNIILDPFLIFGIGFFPAWGVKGAAVATLFSQILAALSNFIYLLSRRSGYRLRWSYLRPNLSILIEIYRVGLPTFVMQSVGSLILMVMNRILGAFGSEAIAANGLAFRLLMLIVMPVAGLAQGLMPLVGYNYSAKKWTRLWSAVRLASLASLSLIGVGYVLLQLFPAFWIRLFTQDADFLPLAVQAARVATLVLPLVGPLFMWMTMFQALGRGSIAMIISLSRQFIFLLPLLLILPRFMGLTGVWAAIPISDALTFLLASGLIWREYKKQKRTQVGRKEAPEICADSLTPTDWAS